MYYYTKREKEILHILSELYKLVQESKHGNKDSMMKIINKLPIHNKEKMGKEQFIVGYIHKSIINK